MTSPAGCLGAAVVDTQRRDNEWQDVLARREQAGVESCRDAERPQLARDIHDLLGEVNSLVLTMALRGEKDCNQTADLITRLLACAEQAQVVGKIGIARHLRQVADMLEKENARPEP